MPILPSPPDQIETRAIPVYAWDYNAAHPELRALYERAKRQQWNASEALDWAQVLSLGQTMWPEGHYALYGSELWEHLSEPERLAYRRHIDAWLLSQFLHGAQATLLAMTRVADSVPRIEAKLCVAAQGMDEARHIEVLARCLRERYGLAYPIDSYLRTLLDIVLQDSRWDVQYLGTQLLIEGLAMGAFQLIAETSAEPLLKQIIPRILADEARHVAFGVYALRGLYQQFSPSERREREDFAYETCAMLRDRFLAAEVYESLGLPADECVQHAATSPTMIEFRKLLFSRVVPNLKKLGLLSPRLRPRYEQLGILAWENYEPDEALALGVEPTATEAR